MFDWLRRRSRPPERRPPPRENQSSPPAVTLRWLLGLSGYLSDGSNESIRFRENIESPNIRLAELQEWAGQCLEPPPDEQRLFALQDIVNSLGTRLGFQVEYGVYHAENADWMPFDGLWRLREDLYLGVEVFSEPLERIDFSQLARDLASLERNPAIGKAETVACFILCAGASAEIEAAVRVSPLHDRIRLLPLGTLFDLLRMDQEGVLNRRQLPVLLRPFSPVGVHKLLAFLEDFIGAYEGESPAEPARNPELPSAPPPPKVPEVSLESIVELHDSGAPGEARDRLTAYLSAHPEDPLAWEVAAEWARDEGDMEAAIRAYKAALSRDRTRSAPVVALATIYRERGEYSTALGLLDAAGGLKAPHPVLLERSRLLLVMNHLEEAEEAAQAAHAASAGTPALKLLGRARQARGDLEGAVAAYATSLDQDPDDLETRDLLETAQRAAQLAEPLSKTGS